jgi:hypothetical protein
VRAVLVLLALLGAGCSLGSEQASKPANENYFPSWIDETYADGRLTLRYPSDWGRSRSQRFGELLNDDTERTAAFIGVQYLPKREYGSHAEFADLAAAILRPPSGEGTTLEYTQTARIGDRPGIEASIIWAANQDDPLGPTMRVYGTELDSGEVAIIIFAAESQTAHAAEFGWIKRSITWDTAG